MTRQHTGLHVLFGAPRLHEESGVNPNGGVIGQKAEAERRPAQRGSPRGSTATTQLLATFPATIPATLIVYILYIINAAFSNIVQVGILIVSLLPEDTTG